jgi:hypothetical protein
LLSDIIIKECQKGTKIETGWRIYYGERCLESSDLERQVRHLHTDKYA